MGKYGEESRPGDYKTFHTQLIKVILLINVKMPTIVGILTFIRSKTTSGNSIARAFSISQHLNLYEQFKFYAHLFELSMKKVLYSGPGVRIFRINKSLWPVWKTMTIEKQE